MRNKFSKIVFRFQNHPMIQDEFFQIFSKFAQPIQIHRCFFSLNNTKGFYVCISSVVLNLIALELRRILFEQANFQTFEKNVDMNLMELQREGLLRGLRIRKRSSGPKPRLSIKSSSLEVSVTTVDVALKNTYFYGRDHKKIDILL